MKPDIAYKILTFSQFTELQNDQFAGSAVDLADGYIHLSNASQLDETLNKHFAGQDDLIIAAIELTKLGQDLRWETSRGGQLFPHFYGQLRMHHVSAHHKLTRDITGRAILPN